MKRPLSRASRQALCDAIAAQLDALEAQREAMLSGDGFAACPVCFLAMPSERSTCSRSCTARQRRQEEAAAERAGADWPPAYTRDELSDLFSQWADEHDAAAHRSDTDWHVGASAALERATKALVQTRLPGGSE